MRQELGAIRTRYNGTLFRSKLEADWARFFDSLAIPWEYEREGRYYGDVFYLPDFWLPHSKQHVEVKGRWEPDDCRKAFALVQGSDPRPYVGEELGAVDVPLVAANPGGVFWGYTRHPQVPTIVKRQALAAARLTIWLPPRAPDPDLGTILLEHVHPVELAQCFRCEGWWFFDSAGSWHCQCCGAGDGNKHIADQITSPIRPWPALTGGRF